MARPQKNNADYFPHDADMRNDAKVKAVRRSFGHLGYSIYVMLIEFISDQDYFMYELNDLNLELMAGDFDLETEKLQPIIDYLVKLDLFQFDTETKILSNKTLNNRLETVLRRRKPTLNGVNVDNNPQRKEKKRKENENKENNNTENLSLDEKKELKKQEIYTDHNTLLVNFCMKNNVSKKSLDKNFDDFLDEQLYDLMDNTGLNRDTREVFSHFLKWYRKKITSGTAKTHYAHEN